jgi:acetolactate synthase small subunit
MMSQDIEGDRRRADAAVLAYVQRRPGVLARIAGMLDRRGIDVHSWIVVPGCEPQTARVELRLRAPERELDLLVRALDNLVDVLSVERSCKAPASELAFAHRRAASQA